MTVKTVKFIILRGITLSGYGGLIVFKDGGNNEW